MVSEKQTKPVLTTQHIVAIESVLAKGDRVELVPEPGGIIKILCTRRKVVKINHQKPDGAE